MTEETLFADVLARPPPERAAYLSAACAGDASLRQRVEALLAAHDPADSFLERPVAANGHTGAYIPEPPTSISEKPGARIGPYKLLQQIGEGGMGVVYMAEQEHPVRRRVALKIIKPGMDTAQVVARFEAERQALALMDHQNIAKVLDVGATESGRPYFVMELVNGIPITAYCDQEHLTPRERLELFVPICQAIQHAHQKGIIHRDLKPSNVLVALYDGKPVPKVIDFGVAKATSQRLTERTMFTEFGQVIGTLEYMAPEQAERNALDVDTRCDIYSLGVLLYELLTGTTPLDKTKLRSAAYDEMMRMIREDEPEKPSTRLSHSGDALPSISAQRKTEPAKLSKLVRGELDWIVMKALEKDRGRRYETANGFAMDVQRFLADEAVLAYPPSAAYRFKKFVRRNKATVVATGTLFLVVAIGALGTSIGMIHALRAGRSAQIAHERTRQALDDMTSTVAQQWLVRQPRLSPDQKRFLESVSRYYQEFADENPVDEKARWRVVNALGRLGQMQRALGNDVAAASTQERGAIFVEALAREFPDNLDAQATHARMLKELAQTRSCQGNWSEADRHYHKSLTIFEALLQQSPREDFYRVCLCDANLSYGNWLSGFERHADSETRNRRAWELSVSLTDEFPRNVEYLSLEALSLNGLGQALMELNRLDDAEPLLRKSLVLGERLRDSFPSNPVYRLTLGRSYMFLGDLLKGRKDSSESEPAYRHALAIFKGVIDEFPGDLDARINYANTLPRLGRFLQRRGNWAQAESVTRQAFVLNLQLIADYPDSKMNPEGVLNNGLNLGFILSDKTNQAKQAMEVYRQAIAAGKELVKSKLVQPRTRKDLARVYSNLAILLRNTNNYTESEDCQGKAIALVEQLLAETPHHRGYRGFREMQAEQYGILAGTLQLHGRQSEAEAAYRKALATMEAAASRQESDAPESHIMIAQLNMQYGTLVRQLRGPTEAEPFLLTALRHNQAVVDLQPDNLYAKVKLANSLANAGQHDRASELAERLLRDFKLPGSDIYNMVCVFAVGAGVPDKVAGEKSALRAMELLRLAAKTGMFADGVNIAYLKNDYDLIALHGRVDFKAFVAELAAPAKEIKP